MLPIFWVTDGFEEPSEKMAKSIKFGLDVIEYGPPVCGVIFVIFGFVFLLCFINNWRSHAICSKKTNLHTVY